MTTDFNVVIPLPEHESDYRRALRDNEPLIVSSLNLMSILPHLNACSLLTEAENDEMRLRDVPEHDKIGKLVGILVRKGEEGFHKFIAALERASDHLTHKTIAETLKQSLKKCKCHIRCLAWHKVHCLFHKQ